MNQIITSFTLIILSINTAYACYKKPFTSTEINDYPIERVLSQNGNYLLEMYPAKWIKQGNDFNRITDAIAIVYDVAKDGRMTKLWETKGIYPATYNPKRDSYFPNKYSHYISNDGNKIVSILESRVIRDKTSPLVLIKGKLGAWHRISHDQIKAASIYSCRMHFFRSHELMQNDDLKLENLVASDQLGKSWLIKTDTGQLIRN
ncbi:hypothetical protein [Leucothrix arctica]|uniref:Uncharacterized protein n=1 Tax=Leucothrix arctica TaxID=1481894 RepID=A0A317CCI9_9GAMM|nr:hypothetical protein [Leucothrix arctica]PWQ96405.1 hypothetical protein DKT75_10505 [Leucothrix arctica]